ncbi:MAG: hypothetical protein AAGI52_08300 [Bacteroidota bacterium]
MSRPEFVHLKRLDLRRHSSLDERWVQEIIADDPTILGLGDLILKDKERAQLRAGRLDLLLQHSEDAKRYEVEVQLGPTDESHIIRCIEYWDIERKRYPQYDHTAVLVAEDITSRFLNVISLLNGTIPLIAIQMSALEFEGRVALTFTTVLDVMPLGLVDEDEEVMEVTDRSYWESRGTKETVRMADAALELARRADPSLDLKYNKFYIGLARDGRPFNFVFLRPQKRALKLEMRMTQSEEFEASLVEAGLDPEYLPKHGLYRLHLREGDISAHAEALADALRQSYEHFSE